MKEKLIVTVALLFCMALAGCDKSVEQKEFLAEYGKTADEIVSRVRSDHSTKGIKEAQGYLDSQKSALKAKFDAGKSGSFGKGVDSNEFTTNITASMKKVSALAKEYPSPEMDILEEDFRRFVLR